MKKILPCALALITVILCFTLPAAAATFGAPQNMDGLQIADIDFYLGDLPSPLQPILNTDQVIATTAYTSGVDLAAIIYDSGTMLFTKARLVFNWSSSDSMNINAICIKNIPPDFKVTVSASGTSSMTGESYSQAFAYVDQQDGWSRYDTFSFSATQTPVFSNVTSLSITIDGGSALLSTLVDDDIILSLSMLPYNLSAVSDRQYNIGYQDAQKVYSSILQQEKQNSYDLGVNKGYSDGYNNAQTTLVPEARQEGYDEGYVVGKNDGIALGENSDLRQLIFTIPEAYLTALEGFTNWTLLGYNLYDLLGGIVVLVCIAVIIKFGIKLVL